jgi:hypothetical protein
MASYPCAAASAELIGISVDRNLQRNEENADLLRFLSGPGMFRHFRRLQAVENGAIRESRLANRELINARMAFDQHFLSQILSG